MQACMIMCIHLSTHAGMYVHTHTHYQKDHLKRRVYTQDLKDGTVSDNLTLYGAVFQTA